MAPCCNAMLQAEEEEERLLIKTRDFLHTLTSRASRLLNTIFSLATGEKKQRWDPTLDEKAKAG